MHGRGTALAVVVLGAAAGLAGCSAGDDGDGFEPTCPSWTRGRGGLTVAGAFHRNFTDIERSDALGTGALEVDGKPLDRVSLEFYDHDPGSGQVQAQGIVVRDGNLRLQVVRSDGQVLGIYDERAIREVRTEWSWGPGTYEDFTLQVDIAPATGEPDPMTATARWTFARNLDGDSGTPSEASIRYNAGYWYRQC